jgi:hypothetical protein
MNNNNKKKITNITKSQMKSDTTGFRLNFIRDLLGNNKLGPLIDLDKFETENFINAKKTHIDESIDSNEYSNDTRYILGKEMYDFKEVMTQIGGNLTYIKSGSTGHTFKGENIKKDGTIINYAIKVVAYPKGAKYGQLNDVRRPENAELLMIRLLSYFVVNKHTPHIVLPIATFNTDIQKFINMTTDIVKKSIMENPDVKKREKKKENYEKFLERHYDGKYHSNISILISEWANNGDLLDYIRKNYKIMKLIDWKVIFFQIISVLAVIQAKYPSFRHNDMKANNILLHKVESSSKNCSYKINGERYSVPRIGYIIKLWDFDFACIPGIVDNLKVRAKWTNDINVNPGKNRYYDIHYFFNTLSGFLPQILKSKSVPKEIMEFINRIIPPIFREGQHVSESGRILANDEHTTPDKILKNDELFQEFRHTQKKVNYTDSVTIDKLFLKKRNDKKTI